MSRRTAELPKGWEMVRLADVAIPSTEKVQPSEFGALRHVGLEHIESRFNRIIGTGDARSVRSTKTMFRSGDILYGKLRPYLNKVCQPDFDGVCSTDILVFPAIRELDSRYLLHFLSLPSTVEYATQHSRGINLPRISAKTLGNIEFPLAPLSEQRRIVAKIDAFQERSRKLREILAELVSLLDRFRQSLLVAAFRGDLTAGWRARNPEAEPAPELLFRVREERRTKWEQKELSNYRSIKKHPPGGWKSKYREPAPAKPQEISGFTRLPKSWCWGSSEEIVAPGAEIVYGIIQPGKKLEEGVPYVRGKDIVDGQILVHQLLRTSESIGAKYERSSLKSGDVLLGIIRTTKVAIVPDELAGGNITQGTARFRPSNAITTKMLACWLDSPCAQDWLHARLRGIDMPGLNLRDVRRLPVPIAPLEEQLVLEKLIEQGMDFVCETDSRLTDAGSALSQMDEAVLERAFRGELVPQNHHDEPSSRLVDQIRKARSQQGKQNSRPRTKAWAPMRQATKAKLKEWIQTFGMEPFTFEEINDAIPLDYDELKNALYAMLDERSEIEQVFDDASGSMRFRRIRR